jgi:hypothetical protein
LSWPSRDLPAEDVGQLLPLLVADIDAIEARERARMITGRVEDAHVGRDGLLVVLDLVFVQLTDLGLDRDPLVAVGRELELLLVDPEQIFERALAEVQTLERVERLIGSAGSCRERDRCRPALAR